MPMEMPATSAEERGFNDWPEFASEGLGVLGGGEGRGEEELGGGGGKEELGGGGVDVVEGGGDTVEAIDEDEGDGGGIWPCRYDVCPGTLKRKTRKFVSEKFSSEGLAKYF